MIADAARIRRIARLVWIVSVLCFAPAVPCLAQRLATLPTAPPAVGPWAVAQPRSSGPNTLLNEVGRLQNTVPSALIQQWKHQLRSGHLNGEAAAWRHLWLGEVQLGHEDQPERALEQFAITLRLTPRTKLVHGLAAYDSAQALWSAGAYTEAAEAFRALLAPKTALLGYDRRTCALWFRHASACAGYHAQRAQLGIPEPPRLDPLCGVAGLAACLRAMHLPYNKPRLLGACLVGGRGNTMQDLVKAAHKLGVAAHALTCDEEGLCLLPKPLIAHVEHDHFITVLRADRHGVSYLCSDCGPWPGGHVNLTWSQWRKLEADAFLAIIRRNSEWDQALNEPSRDPANQRQFHASAPNTSATLTQRSGAVKHDVVTVKRRSLSARHSIALTTRVFAATHPLLPIGMLGTHVRLLENPILMTCAFKYDSLHSNGIVKCPFDCHHAKGAAQGEPVNMATGEEEYTPPPDLAVYNPIGPSVVWDHFYNSLRSGLAPGEYLSYGIGWSHRYNAGVYFPSINNLGISLLQQTPVAPPVPPTPHRDATTGTPLNLSSPPYLLLPNGAQIYFLPTGTPSSASKRIPCVTTDAAGNLLTGIPLCVEWDYSSSQAGGYFNLCFPDGTVWVTTLGVLQAGNCGWYPLGQIVDRNNQYINLNYAFTSIYTFPFLTSITDCNTTPRTLLTINHTTNAPWGAITSVVDCYNRQVNYTYSIFSVGQGTWAQLNDVSEIVASGTASGPPYRYQYNYTYYSIPYPTPFLSSITTPSPSSANATVTASIYYDPNDSGAVSYISDGNGYKRVYTVVDGSHTKVTVEKSDGSPVTSYTVGFDGNMSETSRTDGTNTTQVYQATFNDPNDPYRPSEVTDGNGNVWQYQWDAFGNLESVITPRNTTTSYTYNYNTYATGELVKVQEGSKSPTSLAYDTLGRLQTLTSPLPGTAGSSSTVTTTIAYSTLGNIASITTPGNNATLVNGGDAGITTSFNYTADPTYSRTATEAYGQPLTMTRSIDVANPTDPNNITHFWYDNQANCTQVVYPILTSLPVPYGTLTATYNIANQPTQIQVPGLVVGTATQSYTYQWPGGPCVGVQYGLGPSRQINYTLGNEGELLSVSGNVQSESYLYDAAYRLIGIKDGTNLNTTQYLYNTAGYLSQILYPMNSVGQTPDSVSFPSYDNAGHVLTRVDGRNVTTTYTYNDPESRLTKIAYSGTYSHDNTTLGYDMYGRLESVTDGAGSRSYAYDDNDLLTAVDTTFYGLAGTVAQTYSFYNDGQRKGEAFSVPGTSLGSFSYLYDTAARLTSLTNPQGESFSYTYYDTDWVASQTDAFALSSSFRYDLDGYLLSVLNQPSGAAQAASSFAYQRDFNLNTANLQSQFGSSSIVNTSFSYDALNRLTNENTTAGASLTHSYDNAGNPTELRNVGGLGYNPDNQPLSSSYVYDGNGNPTTYPLGGVSSTLTFDEEDRVTKLVPSGSSAHNYAWRADGLRSWKQTAGGTNTYFLYDGDAPVFEFIIQSDKASITAVNTFGPTGVASRHLDNPGNSTFYAWDGRGNVAQTVNTSGLVTGSFLFDGYGKATMGTPTDPYSGYGGQWGYYTDLETGLTLCGHRFYDANAARFLNRDPIGQAGGANLYQYVGGSPLMDADPSGLQEEDTPLEPETPTEFEDAYEEEHGPLLRSPSFEEQQEQDKWDRIETENEARNQAVLNELLHPGGEGQVEQIPTERAIQADPVEFESMSRRERREWMALLEDIKQRGILDPVDFIEDPECPGQYYILDGNHRTQAAQYLGIKTIPGVRRTLPFLSYKTWRNVIP